MTTVVNFINEGLLSVGEREFMTSTLSTTSQRRAFKIFKDTFQSFTHEGAWSFLVSTFTPTLWVSNVATVPQYQKILSVYLDGRILTPVFNTEAHLLETTTSGVYWYCLQDSKHISFYGTPTASDKLLIKVNYIKEITVPAITDTLPLTDDFEHILQLLFSAQLSSQMLDDESSYNRFMREYAIRVSKAVQRDQQIPRSRPNMFRGGR